ncbi:titin [Ictalurus furcatus]|uniref:titin n=1 Tax=Ictalurus furcatus TaxID=66913 RepID=UPI0023504D1B|nr:titin [Ictalurus furcatus]
MLDDDIEKRVLVNKDGSLSMEMKVRFRLLNDETLHCSTEIKKSSCTFNVSFPGQDNVYYPQCGHGESCSEAESLSASEADDVYITKLYQKHLEAPHCQHCCTHCQEYDIWKNPAHSEQESLRHIGSTSSSAPSHKIKCKKGSVDSVHTTSCEEYTEQVVEKATCIQQTVGEGDKGDTTVQYCTISRCSSRSEVYSVSAKAKKAGYTDEKYGKNESIHGFAEEEKRPVPSKDLKQDQMSVPITQVSTEDERPLSVETNSSDILASLKEDEDNEETDLSPSNSRASQSSKENDEQTKNAVVSSYSFIPCKPLGSPKQSLSHRTSSTASCCSVKSKTLRKFVVTETQENVNRDKNNTPSSTPHRCQHKESTDDTTEEKLEAINQSEDILDETDVLDTETDVRAQKSVSDLSKTCDDTSDYTIERSQTNEKGRSSAMSTPPNPHADLTISNTCVVTEQEFGNLKDPTVGHAKNKTEESADVTHEEKVAIAMSPKSNVSARSSRSRLSEVACKERKTAELQKGESAQSVMSVHSNASTISKQSTVSELLDNETEDQTEEVMPCALSKISRSSKMSDLETSELREMEDQIEDRSPSIMFVKSSISESTPVKLVKVQSSESLTSSLSTNISVESITSKISEGTPVDMDNRLLMERVPTAMSAKSDVSIKSKTSNILDISPHDSNVAEEATEDRAPSTKSNKSNTSSRSNASKISLVATEEADVVEEKRLKRPSSVMSSKSDVSVKSKTSNILDISPHDSNVVEEATEDRAPSAKSNKSNTSSRSNASKISLVAPEEADVVEEKRLKRPSSVMSSKSDVSVKSKTSNILDISPHDSNVVEEAPEDRAPSAKSNKSNTSSRSNASKISLVAPEEADVVEEKRLKRPSSVMSSKSDVSVKSKTSNILDISPHDSNVVEEAPEDRAPSAKSNKSNTSSRSNASKISLVAPEEADVVEEKRLKSPSSVRSSKSAASLRSTKSKLRDEKDDITAEKTEQLQDRYITRVMPSKPSDSELSKKTKTFEATLDKSGDFEDNSEEQAPSTMATMSNTPTKSNKSEMLEMGMGEKEERPLTATSSKSKKSEKCMISEAVQACDHSEERPAGIISSTSVKSKRSVVSDAPCEHEEEETKQTGRKSQNALSVRSQRSRESKASEASRTNTGNEDNRERAQSAMSCISILSDRSNLAPDGVDNTGSTEDLLKETESAYEETKDDRAASAMSSKSQMSSLSNKSKDVTQERAPTSMSEKSKVSIKPKNSKMDQSKDEGEEKHERISISASPNFSMSARSKKNESLAVVSPAEMENQHTERTLSAMSGKSNTSKTSKKKKEELVERSPSALSAKSNTSVRSKESDTQSNRPMDKIHHITISPKSSTSAKDEKLDFSIISNNSPKVDVKSEKTWDMSDMSPKSSVSSRSVKSNISALDGGQTVGVSLNEKSDSVLSGLKISMTENLNNAYNEGRASSALSKKSNTSSVHHTSERVLTPASTSVSIGIVDEYDVDYAEEDNSVSLASVNSTPQLKSKTDVYCKDSSKMIENKNQQCMQTPDDRAKSSLTAETIVSDKSKESECTHKNCSQPVTDNEMANNKSIKKNTKKSSSRSLCSRSAHSDFDSSKTKDRNSPAVTDRPKSNMSNTMLHLEVNGQSANAKCNSVGERSKSNLSSDEEEISRLHSTAVLITSVSTDNEPVISVDVSNRRSSPSNENANKLNTTRDLNVCGRTCNGSLVSTDCSRDVSDNKSEKNSNSSCRHSSSSMTQEVDNNSSELVPSILPSSSPTEVVNEWLKKIPLDSDLYDVGDEFHENCEEEELLKMSGKVTQYERGKGSEGDTDAAVLRPQNEQLGVEEIENNESKVGDVKETAKDVAVVENIQPCTFPDVPSSVQLMRILLSPKLDRCNSLPEVSPVYGRKLSTSARGFLDSLVNLQLLDLDPNDVNGKAEKYNDLMDTLQSLWLCDTSDRVAITQKSKFNNQQFKDEEFNVKPSSGVDITSSSQDSGTSSVNESTVTQKSRTNIEGEDIEILTKVHEIDKTETVFEGIETKSDSATPDIASRVQWTPENEAEENLQDSNILSAVSDFTIRNDYSPREPPDTVSISNKSSGNDSNANQKLTDHEEDTSSESPSLEQMAQLTEKVSQDPDPVWVLNLLNKIEKQFMTHYITAMAEFKVRWNLNDNEQLDAMICELRDEVHKRIQASINNELRKFQGHTGRPRPPKETMSRESSILTEQRRRRLKVHLNQSIDTGSGILMNDLGNQGNDDEYCPCDTCMKKKTSSKPALAMEVLNFAPHAPLMTDFDLRKILNFKRKAPSNSKENVKETDIEDASNTQPNKSEQQNNDQPMREGNNTSRALEQESPIVGGELGDHVELRNGTNADPTTEDENAQSGLADMVTEIKITEAVEEVCDELPEGQESVEDETVREEHTLEAGTAKDNMAIEVGTVGEHEVTEGESTGGKGTEVQTSDAETGDETAEDKTLDKKESMGESTSEDNEAAEGDISESEPEEEGEIPDEEKEKHEDAKTETTWKNMLVKPDIAVEAESTKGDAAGKEVATIATEEPKIKSEIIEDVKEAEHKSDGIMYLEDGTDEEDDTAEAEKSESTDNEETDEKNESAEEDVSIKKTSKESGEDDLFDEEMISEPEEDGDITDHESAEEANPINNESEKGETDNDELDAEGKTTKTETAADEELADNETAEYRENFYDGALDRTEIIKVKTAEIGETNNNVTTKDGEMSVDKVADVGETSEANAAEDNDYESAEDAETSKAQTAENTSDDETAENGETPKAKISEDGEVTDDEIANDAGAADGVTGDTETADDRDTDDDEISEIEEMFCNETVDNGVTAKAKNMKPHNMKKATEYEETHDDGTSEDGDSAGAVVADNEETAEATEESENNNDDESTEEPEGAKTKVAEETVDSEIIEAGEAHTKALKQFVGDKMNIDNVQKTEGEQTNDENANDETAEDTEMDRNQSEEDGETADDEADIGEIADDGRAEHGETPNNNTANDGTAEKYGMEEVDETTEAETAEDGEKDDDGRTDGQIGDEVTDDEAITGTENEENEETAEAETGEDIETADNGTIEDGDTADERKAEDEELSENEIAQNGEIAKGRIEVYDQTDDIESLENGETAGEVNGETHEKNTDEAVINSHNVKTKQNSEMMSINQDAEMLESNRYNVNIYSVNNRESDEGGDEAEDETEPIVETDERAFYQGLKIPAMQSTKWSLHKDVHADERTIAPFDSAVKMYPASEDGEDADGEESETEVHNKGGSVENEEDG